MQRGEWQRGISMNGAVTWRGWLGQHRAKRRTFKDGRMVYWIELDNGKLRQLATHEWRTAARIDHAIRIARAGLLAARGLRDAEEERAP